MFYFKKLGVVLVFYLFSCVCRCNQTLVRVKRLDNSPEVGYLTESDSSDDITIGEKRLRYCLLIIVK